MAMQSGDTLGPPPDGFQGWGRLSLAGALPLPGISRPHFRLQVADMGTIKDGEAVYLHGIRATGTGRIRVVLVWYDYPAALQATTALVNDLDLKYSINGGQPETTRDDHVNNVEVAELRNPTAGDNITLVVLGTRVIHQLLTPPSFSPSSSEYPSLTAADQGLPQRWALAVVGDFQGVLQTQRNPMYARPIRLQGFSSQQQWLNGSATSTAMSFTISSWSESRESSCLTVETASDGAGEAVLVASQRGCSMPQTYEFTEEAADESLGGYLYVVSRRSNGSDACITFRNGSNSSAAFLSACEDGNEWQRLALFKNSYYAMQQVYQLVPKLDLGSDNNHRLCLTVQDDLWAPNPAQQDINLPMAPPSTTPTVATKELTDWKSPLALLPCNPDYTNQAFILQISSAAASPMSGPLLSPSPPSFQPPPPPLPTPPPTPSPSPPSPKPKPPPLLRPPRQIKPPLVKPPLQLPSPKFQSPPRWPPPLPLQSQLRSPSPRRPTLPLRRPLTPSPPPWPPPSSLSSDGPQPAISPSILPQAPSPLDGADTSLSTSAAATTLSPTTATINLAVAISSSSSSSSGINSNDNSYVSKPPPIQQRQQDQHDEQMSGQKQPPAAAGNSSMNGNSGNGGKGNVELNSKEIAGVAVASMSGVAAMVAVASFVRWQIAKLRYQRVTPS